MLVISTSKVSTPKYTVLSNPLKYTSDLNGPPYICTHCTCGVLYNPGILGCSLLEVGKLVVMLRRGWWSWCNTMLVISTSKVSTPKYTVLNRPLQYGVVFQRGYSYIHILYLWVPAQHRHFGVLHFEVLQNEVLTFGVITFGEITFGELMITCWLNNRWHTLVLLVVQWDSPYTQPLLHSPYVQWGLRRFRGHPTSTWGSAGWGRCR